MADKLEAVASAVAMIRTMDVHEAAKAMAKKLKLNAEIRTCVGKWDERGSVVGWVTSGRTAEPVSTLVEVFVSDIAGEDREFRRYARKLTEAADEITRLNAEVEEQRFWLRKAGEVLAPHSADPAGTPTRDALVFVNAGLNHHARPAVRALITKASRDSGHG